MLNQSCLEDFGLIKEIDQQAAETISGGAQEVFTIKNKTSYNITYVLDGRSWLHKPDETWIWTATSGGTISFDKDSRADYNVNQDYDLSDGRIYEFQDNPSPGNPYDLELYSVG
ncbi:hypothetical protein H6G76_21370 [Nostoc sp. FACHB-152]|uniref:hypothetical protein n=1 Tax=unclassified Nostoc TaxID=2593658 RepID=UPI0016877D7D|nr:MULTISPECIES: hypothetical protein [unclassified Nostoc]MBD2449671.1 hypothetical protein [Nostoc sp. FACHB-152]MBD2469665.1 hypothetical protein [Nostoc sp. FACHB-145]